VIRWNRFSCIIDMLRLYRNWVKYIQHVCLIYLPLIRKLQNSIISKWSILKITSQLLTSKPTSTTMRWIFIHWQTLNMLLSQIEWWRPLNLVLSYLASPHYRMMQKFETSLKNVIPKLYFWEQLANMRMNLKMFLA